MTSETSTSQFVFDYHEVMALAREYDRFGSTQISRNVSMIVGLTGHEVWQFAQRLKRELLGEETPRRRSSDVSPELKTALDRVKELEAEVSRLKYNQLLLAGVAL